MFKTSLYTFHTCKSWRGRRYLTLKDNTLVLEVLRNAASYLLAFGIVVSVHEWGHYLVAKRLGIKVLRLCIGVGTPLFSRRGRGADQTEYILRALPLGGYVEFLTDLPCHCAMCYYSPTDRILTQDAQGNEKVVTREELHDDKEHVEPLVAAEKARAFQHQTSLARAAVFAAGPGMNFVFAILILALARLLMNGGSALEAVQFGAMSSWMFVSHTAHGIFDALTGVARVKDLSGGIAIARLAGDSALMGAAKFLATLSILVGLVNLLPIPKFGGDGSQLLGLLIEALKGSSRTKTIPEAHVRRPGC
jgi:regulator of sigma E protease